MDVSTKRRKNCCRVQFSFLRVEVLKYIHVWIMLSIHLSDLSVNAATEHLISSGLENRHDAADKYVLTRPS